MWLSVSAINKTQTTTTTIIMTISTVISSQEENTHWFIPGAALLHWRPVLFRDNKPETADITSNSEAAVTLLEKVH